MNEQLLEVLEENKGKITEVYTSDGSLTRCTSRNIHGLCLEISKDLRVLVVKAGVENLIFDTNPDETEIRLAEKFARSNGVPLTHPPQPFGASRPL